ncbi:MAG: hypothetical protein GXO81_10450 [Chlorobi bacterium]|nr:hypothetical protein [Chlorobiota bacterium]
MKRRNFMRTSGTFVASVISFPTIASLLNDEKQIEKWLKMKEDPVYSLFKNEPNLDQILKLYPRPQGKAAFDPNEINLNVEKLKTFPQVNTGHPFLDRSIKVGLAHIDATFKGNHPKYGVGVYGRLEHDGFPPTIIAAVDALTLWGMNERAAELFHYWIINFVNINDWLEPKKQMGEIVYYGTSIAEYGQLLDTATLLYERAGKGIWWDDCFNQINLLAEYLLQLHANALKDDGLISGVPEADTRGNKGKYFHNNAWVVKGLKRWVKLCEIARVTPTTSLTIISKSADKLKENTLSAIKEAWPVDQNAWWLPALKGSKVQPKSLTDGREANYTNYRYWPELLSSDILPPEMANRVINARLSGGGQFCGMTRFMNWLDDWPLTDYLYSLWKLGRKKDFLLSLYGHVTYHQCEGHLTAYEQFNFPGDPNGSKKADYCLPSQLVAARAGRLINKF